MLGVVTRVLAVVCKTVQIFATIQEDAEQGRIQGRGPGDPAPHTTYILDQTEARRTEKKFWSPSPPLL